MSQAQLDFSAPPALAALLARNSRCARLAKFFLDHRGEWLHARELASIAGFCGWRTRCSELTREPWHLTIEQRNRRTESGAIVSERRLV